MVRSYVMQAGRVPPLRSSPCVRPSHPRNLNFQRQLPWVSGLDSFWLELHDHVEEPHNVTSSVKISGPRGRLATWISPPNLKHMI